MNRVDRWFRMFWVTLGVVQQLVGPNFVVNCARNLEEWEVEYLVRLFWEVFALMTTVLWNRPPYTSYLEREGYIPVEKIRERRRLNKDLRETNNDFHASLGDPWTSGILAFDYLGIRWLQSDRWGEDHPVDDWHHPVSMNPNSIFEFHNTWKRFSRTEYGRASLRNCRFSYQQFCVRADYN